MTYAADRTDVYARVTNRMIEQLEQGVRPWLKPWTATGSSIARPVRHNGEAYRGVNVLILWSEAADKGYTSPMWMTYKQAQELGANVRKGEHGTAIVFASKVTKEETATDGTTEQKTFPILKGYTVFNVEQIDGLPEKYATQPAAVPETTAEAFFAGTGATFKEGGDRAFYSPAHDFIGMPALAKFRDAESYSATKAHELTHWTGHASRMARSFGKRFGDDAYAVEELVAEIGAAFLCADLSITPEVAEDHAAYLSHWLRVLQSDKRAIFTAASQAQAAVDFLNAQQAGAKAAA